MVRSKALQHTRHVLINRLAPPLGAFAVLIMIGRHSDALLGEFALVMTFYYIMQMIPLLGLTPYLAREVARRPELAGKFFSSIGLLSVCGCVFVDLLCFAFLGLVDYAPQIRYAILVTGVLIFPGILLFIAEVIFMSLHQARPAAYIAVAENLVRVGFSIGAMHIGGGLRELIWIFFATRLGAFACYVWQMKRCGIVHHFDPPDAAVLRETLGVLPAFLGGAVLFVAFSRMDFLVLSLYEKIEAIGYYAIGYRPFEISIILLTALIMALFPWISRRFVGARRHFRVAVKGLILLFAAGLGLTTLVGILLADEYVLLLFRNQYPHPVLLTQIFMAAMVVAGMDYVTSSLLHASDKQAVDTRAMLVGAAVNLILLFWLVPKFGIYGAFMAKAGATLVQCWQKLHAINQFVGPLWKSGEIRRMLIVVFALGAIALAFVDSGLLTRLLIIFSAILFLPAMMLSLGLFQPIRLLRYNWRNRGAADVATGADLIDVLVADFRRRTRLSRRQSQLQPYVSRNIDRPTMGVVLARIARWLQLGGHQIWAGRVAGIGRRGFRVWIDPTCAIGPGCVLAGNSRVRINARVGANLLCVGDVAVGPPPGRFTAGTVGEDVTLLPGTVIDAGVKVETGSVCGASVSPNT